MNNNNLFLDINGVQDANIRNAHEGLWLPFGCISVLRLLWITSAAPSAIPTSKSATARLIRRKQVRLRWNRRVQKIEMVNTFPMIMTAISSAEIAMNVMAVGFNMMSCLLRV